MIAHISFDAGFTRLKVEMPRLLSPTPSDSKETHVIESLNPKP